MGTRTRESPAQKWGGGLGERDYFQKNKDIIKGGVDANHRQRSMEEMG